MTLETTELDVLKYTVELHLVLISGPNSGSQQKRSGEENDGTSEEKAELPPEYSAELLEMGFITHKSYRIWNELRAERARPQIPQGRVLVVEPDQATEKLI